MSSSPSPAWPTSGGDNTRRGCCHRAVELDPKPRRVLAARGAVHAAVVFDPTGRAFVADLSGCVQAFAPDGRQAWAQQLDGGISATPAVDRAGARLFAATHTGRVYAVQTANGAILWQKEIATRSDARILSDLLFLPRRAGIVLSSWGGRYHLLDAGTGLEQHSWEAGISPAAAATADHDETIYCVRAVWDQGVQFVRVDAGGTETILHRQPEAKRPASRLLATAAPVLDPERRVVYFITNEDRAGVLHAWSVAKGERLWSRPCGACVGATPALTSAGTILLADLAGWVHAVDPDGSPRYRYASGAEYLLAGGVCDARGTMFLGDPLGMVHVISASGVGNTIFEAPRSLQARPAFEAHGDLYVPGTDRRVYVFANRAEG